MVRLPRIGWLQMDRVGIALSGLCFVHCLGTLLLIGAVGLGGGFLLSHRLHEYGLVLAVIIVAMAIGLGMRRHGRTSPFVVAAAGLGFMGLALATPHGAWEASLTIVGVALVSTGHILNLRHAC